MTNHPILDDPVRYRTLVFIVILLMIEYHNSLRTRSYLHRSALTSAHTSSWKQLLDNGDESSFLHMTGFTRHAFYLLRDALFSKDELRNLVLGKRKRGRPQLLNPDAKVGLLLFYIGSTMGIKWICMIFGITPSTCSHFINAMLTRACNKLAMHPFARVQFPDRDKMAQFAEQIKLREPSIDDVIGFMDGLSLATQCTSERMEQNAMYCGYDCDTMVNNIFIYGPDGKVFFCAINYPGSWADGAVTRNFLPFLRGKIGQYKIVVDQGFPRSGDAYGVLVGPLTKKGARKLHASVRAEMIHRSNIYVSLRQASEWGMRALQGSFPRFKSRLPSNSAKREKVIRTIVLVHNFRTHLIGRNQIKTVFDPEYERSVAIEGHDKIYQYYFQEGDYVSDSDDDLGEEE